MPDFFSRCSSELAACISEAFYGIYSKCIQVFQVHWLNTSSPPTTASLFSPERSNLFSYQAFVEEGCGSQLSQSLSDVSAELSSSPQKQGRRHGNIASLVSPYSHGASRKGTDPEKNTSSLSRLQDTGVFSSFSASYSRESTPMSPTSPLIVDSPTHQYIVTGSTSGCHHSDESFHGNDSGGPSHFLFPSANPGSPTETEGSHGNNTPVNKPNSTDENREAESVLLGFGETAREGRGEEGEEGETSESQRRKELSEKMKMSVERGLGGIMAQIVEEGRPQVAGGGEGEVEKEEEKEEGERVEEQKEKENEIRELDQNGKEMMTENEGAKEGEREEGERKEEEGEREQMAGETVEVLRGEEEHEDLVVKIEETGEVEMKETGEVEMKEKHQQQEELKEIQSDVITVTTLDSSPRPVATATAAGHAYQRESCVIVNPVHKTSASLLFHQEPGEEGGAWMNLSDQFQSAMNIIDSFSTAMDENLGTEPPQTGTKTDTGTNSQNETKSSLRATPTATPTTPDKKKQEKPQDLVSPDRRKKLVEQAAKRIPFKRAHTFDVGVSHTPSPPVGHAHPTSRTPSSSPAQSRAKREGRDLVSKARKDRMMNDALAKMRQRFASNN